MSEEKLQVPQFEKGQVKGVRYDEWQNLEGKMLTFAESLFDDKERREAVKSQVRELLWAFYRELSQIESELELRLIEGTEKLVYKLDGEEIEMEIENGNRNR